MVSVRSVRMVMSSELGSVSRRVGSRALMRSTTSMTLAPGWRWTFTITACVLFAQAAIRVFSCLLDRRHVANAHRRTVAVGHDDVAERVGIGDLVVGVDGERARRPVEIALGVLTLAFEMVVRRSSMLRP